MRFAFRITKARIQTESQSLESGIVSKSFTDLLATLIIVVPVYCTYEHCELTPIYIHHNRILHCIPYTSKPIWYS
jgi:hypothetical protein